MYGVMGIGRGVTQQGPVIYIDEGLVLGLGRTIWVWNGFICFMYNNLGHVKSVKILSYDKYLMVLLKCIIGTTDTGLFDREATWMEMFEYVHLIPEPLT